MISFEDTELGLPDLKLLFFRTLYDWIIATGLFSFSSLQNFLDSCNSFDHQVYAYCTSCFLSSIKLYYLSKKKKKTRMLKMTDWIDFH